MCKNSKATGTTKIVQLVLDIQQVPLAVYQVPLAVYQVPLAVYFKKYLTFSNRIFKQIRF